MTHYWCHDLIYFLLWKKGPRSPYTGESVSFDGATVEILIIAHDKDFMAHRRCVIRELHDAIRSRE